MVATEQKNIKDVVREGATKLFGVNDDGQAAYLEAATLAKLTDLGTKADKENAALEGQPTAPTPDTVDKSDRLATTAFVKDAIAAITPVERATAPQVEAGVLNDVYVTPLAMANVTSKALSAVQPAELEAAMLYNTNVVDFDSLRGSDDTQDVWQTLYGLLTTDNSYRTMLLAGANLRFRRGRAYPVLTRTPLITLPQVLDWDMEGDAYLDLTNNPGLFADNLFTYNGKLGYPVRPNTGDYLYGTTSLSFAAGTVAARGWKVGDRLLIRATEGLNDQAVGAFQKQSDYDASGPATFQIYTSGLTLAVGDGIISVDDGKSYRCTTAHTTGATINLANFTITGLNATGEDILIEAIVGDTIYLTAALYYSYPAAARPIITKYENMGRHTLRNFNLLGNHADNVVDAGAWVTATSYTTTQMVYASSGIGGNDGYYRCVVPHTSGTFSVDLAAGRWVRMGSDRVFRFGLTDKVLIEGGSISEVSGYALSISSVANFVLRDHTGRATNKRASPGGWLALSGPLNSALIDNLTIHSGGQPAMQTESGGEYGVGRGAKWRDGTIYGGNSGFTQHWQSDDTTYENCRLVGNGPNTASGGAGFDLRTPSKMLGCEVVNFNGRAIVLRHHFMGFGRADNSNDGTLISDFKAHNTLSGIVLDDQMFNPGAGTIGWPTGRLNINNSQLTRIGGSGTAGAINLTWTQLETNVAGVFPVLGRVSISDILISMKSTGYPVQINGRWTRPELRDISFADADGYTGPGNWRTILMGAGGAVGGENRPSNPEFGRFPTSGGYAAPSISAVYTDTLPSVASATTLVITLGGEVFLVTGTTTISLISLVEAFRGKRITLVFSSSVTVSHNNGGGGGTSSILLAGAVNFSATANDTLTLLSNGTQWLEVGRSVI